MIDIASLKEVIKGNVDNICALLEYGGYYNIQEMHSQDEVRCATHENGSLKVRVNVNTLASVIFGTEVSGDIFTLIEYNTGLEFRELLKEVCSVLGIDNSTIESYKPRANPFGSFFDNIDNDFYEQKSELRVLDEEDIFNRLCMRPSKMFLDDGISIEQQKRFNIGYDYYSKRICIPYRDTMGNLIGIEGRLNKENLEDGDIKYFPIFKFPKSQVLFGYYENYTTIIKDRVVIVFESAKSVMKLADMKLNCGVATGKSHISSFQKDLILALNPKLVIIAYDEDVEEEKILSMLNSLNISNPYSPIQIAYIKDRDNKYLPKGSKMSPVDGGKEVFEGLMKECLHFVK